MVERRSIPHTPRVLHLIASLGRGGAEQLLVTLLPALKRQGITPVVAVLGGPLDLKSDLESRGIAVRQLPAFHKWNLPAAAGALRRLCRDEKIDIVHAHLYFPSLYAGLLGAGGICPVAETFHNMAYAGANRDCMKLRFRRRLRAFIAGRSKGRFYGVSKAVADHYAAALGLTQVNFLPNVIDLDRVDAALVRKLPQLPPERALKLVVPGRLVPEKGHGILLEALAQADLPPFELVFLGGGPLQQALEKQAQVARIPVTITGVVNHDAFLDGMAQADICLVPSLYEGFGIAAAEAMALAVPVIASDAGGLPEVLGECGTIVPRGDPAALRQAVQQLAANPDLRDRMAAIGAARAREQFAPDRVASQLAADYRKMLEDQA